MIRCAAVRDRGKLDVPDQIAKVCDASQDVAFGPANMVAVKHQFHVGCVHLSNDRAGLIRCLQEVAGRVVAVEWFDQDRARGGWRWHNAGFQ